MWTIHFVNKYFGLVVHVFRNFHKKLPFFHFHGSVPDGCQQESVPTNLKYFVSMLLNGTNLTHQDSTDAHSCLTLSQAIVFNSKERISCSQSFTTFPWSWVTSAFVHQDELHTQTRSKKLITQPYQLGLSVSYNRILQLENQLATSICDVTKEIGLVCPVHFVMDSLPLVLWITWITILPKLQHRTPFMAQALTYFNSPLSPIKDVHKISLHFSQLTQQ